MIWHSHTEKSSKSENELKPKPKRFKDLMHAYWQTYCEKSTIHGVRYLYDPSIRHIERLIWTALVITSLVLTWLSYVILAERFNAQKLETVVENSQYPIFSIPFPAVGICTSNRINWSKVEAARKQFLPVDADKNMLEVFNTFVERMESMRFGKFQSFADMDDINLEVLDFLNVSSLAHYLTLTCEDILRNNSCYWRSMQFECCEGFQLEKTEYGLCLVFNSVYTKDGFNSETLVSTAYYPRHNSMAGQGTGLNFQIILHSKFKRPNTSVDDTISIMIKKPDQWSGSVYTITPYTETFVVVRPEISNTDKSTAVLSPEQRNCIFSDELHKVPYLPLSGVAYRKGNCLNVCHEHYLMQYCNCTLPLYFQSRGGVQQCKPSSFRCLSKNNDIFSYDKRQDEDAFFSAAKAGMLCDCLSSCSSVDYYTSLATLPTTYDNRLNVTDAKIFSVDVHYQSEVIIKYRTSIAFTSIDLIANFGGIFGLCMGASMVSAVELFYHLTIGFGLYLYDNDYYSVCWQHLKKLRQRMRRHWKNSIAEEPHSKTIKTLHRTNKW